MKSKLTEIVIRQPKRKLTQIEKFRFRYGEYYLEILGSKYQNPMYNERYKIIPKNV